MFDDDNVHAVHQDDILKLSGGGNLLSLISIKLETLWKAFRGLLWKMEHLALILYDDIPIFYI